LNVFTFTCVIFQGVEFLVSNGLLEDSAESVAQFLHKGEGLNKTAIGDYLGERYFCNLCNLFPIVICSYSLAIFFIL